MSATQHTIDSDTHVLECEQTWDFLDGADRKLRPRLVRESDEENGDQLWLIDGRTVGSLAHRGVQAVQRRPSLVDVDAGTLENVSKRLAQMDALGIDVQVIFTSVFLHRITDRAEVELPLVRSYNRFMAAKCAGAGGRLQWVMELPWISIADAIDELRECKALGACGVHARGLEMGRIISDPYFYPVFEAAQALGLPICVHAGEGEWTTQALLLAAPSAGFLMSKLPGIIAFHHLFSDGVYLNFPTLRFGFLELSADWIPYVSGDLKLRYSRSLNKLAPERLFDDKNIFVGCQNSDGLKQVFRHIDPSHLVFGTDYGHADTTSDLEGLGTFETSNRPEIVRQILTINPQQLYGL